MSISDFEKHQCKKTRAVLDSYLNDELSIEAKYEAIRHIENCGECSEELEARRRVKQFLQKAVRQDEAPSGLDEKIRSKIRESRSDKRGYWMLAAAAALVLFVATWGIFQWSYNPSSETEFAKTSMENNLQILKVGLGDHIHCAIDKGFANRRFSSDQLLQAMGQEYANVASLVKERVPSDYEITVGHRCRFQGRQFVHLILTKEGETLSLVITKKQGEAFSPSDLATVIEASGVQVHQAKLENFQVTGFETRDHLAFVVSNLSEKNNLTIASGLAPAVRDFLAGLEVQG